MKMLEINNITVGYDKEIDVLKNISLFVEENESVAIIGANGAGKSTTLKTISGLVHPRQGEIIYQGKNINQMQPHEIVKLGIVHVPEDGGTFKSLTIEENLIISCLNEKNKKQNLETVYTFFPALQKKKDELAKNLSGGQRKMLSIGKSIMAEPKLLLLDDISMGLAPKVVSDLYNMLKDLTQALKIPTLIVEQIVDIALDFSSRGYVMAQGELVLAATSQELLNNSEVKKSYLGI